MVGEGKKDDSLVFEQLEDRLNSHSGSQRRLLGKHVNSEPKGEHPGSGPVPRAGTPSSSIT